MGTRFHSPEDVVATSSELPEIVLSQSVLFPGFKGNCVFGINEEG